MELAASSDSGAIWHRLLRAKRARRPGGDRRSGLCEPREICRRSSPIRASGQGDARAGSATRHHDRGYEAEIHTGGVGRSAEAEGGRQSRGRALAVSLHDEHSHRVLEALRRASSTRRIGASNDGGALLPLGSAIRRVRVHTSVGGEAGSGPERPGDVRGGRRNSANPPMRRAGVARDRSLCRGRGTDAFLGWARSMRALGHESANADGASEATLAGCLSVAILHVQSRFRIFLT